MKINPTVTLVVAQVNELAGSTARTLNWLPHSTKAKILLSSIHGGDNSSDVSVVEVMTALEKRFGVTPTDEETAVVLSALNQEEQLQLLRQLTGTKEVGPGVALALAKKEAASSPLYLSMVASELDRISKIPGRIADLFDLLLDELDNPRTAQMLIAVHVSDGALLVSQLERICGVQQDDLDLQKLRAIIRLNRVSAEEEFVSFIHMQARDSVQRRWLNETAIVEREHAKLAGAGKLHLRVHYKT